jgi:magnesium-protoporphyrin IX monomethyl ester (oxidative) cyclase
MKVLLINPPQIFTKSQVTAGVFPPIGLAYIAAFLAKNGHKVKIIDALGEAFGNFSNYDDDIYIRGLTVNELVKKVEKSKPDLIGISNLYTFAYPLVKDISDAIKNVTSVPIVVGGAHVSIQTETVLSSSKIDYVVIGEGEQATLELVEHLDKGSDVSKIDGIGYKTHGKVKINPKLNFIKNLDELPFPARNLLPMENYFKAKEAHGSVKEDKWTPIITSRGCPNNCSFCSTPRIWHRLWRARSAKNVVDEIEECVKKWDIKEIHFNDENVTVDIKRAREICNEIIERKLDIVWQTPNGIGVEHLDKDTLSLMKKSGCYHITVAPENASRYVLNLMNKEINLQHIREVVQWCRQLGIKTASYFIFGFPGERKEDILTTLRYSRLLASDGLDEVVYSLFTPLPGSKMAEKFNKLDYYDFLAMADLNRMPSWYSKEKNYLKRLRIIAYSSFYLTKFVTRPSSFFKFVNNVAHGKQETKTERTVLNIIKYLKVKPNK